MSINNDPLFDAVLRQAVIERNREEMELLLTEQPEKVVISDLCDKRIEKLINHKSILDSGVRRLIITAVIIILVSSGVLMTVPQARAVIFDTISEWMEKRTKFQKNVVEENSLLYEPTLLPRGYEVMTNRGSLLTSLVYRNDDNHLLFYSYSKTLSQTSINNESVDICSVNENGVEYNIIQSEPGNIFCNITWFMDDLWFSLEGFIEADDLLEIAKSVKKMK